MAPSPAPARIDLWWLPVGAGGHVVVHTSRWWEVLRARRERRAPRPLFHAALEVFVDGGRTVVEMTPAWGQPARRRGIVATGPVGSAILGRWRLFRYEVRAWADGDLPDRAYAIAPPLAVDVDRDRARALLDALPRVPRLVWGRRVAPAADMWNSNAVVSWALTVTGVDATGFAPPRGGSAPGWDAGIAVARGAAGAGAASMRPRGAGED